MKTTENKIKAIQQNGYSLNLDYLISKTFENYKKIALIGGIGFLLIALIITAVIMSIIAITIGIETLNHSLTGLQNITNLSSNALIVYLVFMIVISAITAPFTAGIYQIAHHAAMGRDFNFSILFSHYTSKYLKDIILAAVLITSFNLCLTSILEILYIPVLGTFISYFIQLCTLLTIPLIIFGNLTAVQAIQGSYTIVSKQFWKILLLMLLTWLFAITGLIALCIGIFFTIPIIYSAQYMIYRETVGFDAKDTIHEIGALQDDLN